MPNSKIKQLAQSLQKDLVAFLRDIIAIPSMNGKEEAVIWRIKEEMEHLGYHKIRIDGMGNLFGQIGTGKRLLVLDGHVDTVGVGNLENWAHDPFKGNYADGVIYGRGASDQKGGVAAAVYAGKIVNEIGLPADLSLLVAPTVLEEDFEGISWKYILEQGDIKPEAVLLTEPSNLGIRIGQRGRMEIKVRAKGISCHGSAPERGQNAIYRIAPVVRDIDRLNQRLSSSSVLGKGSITVTDIKSSAPSLCAVPDLTTLHLDRRLTEGETMDSCLKEIMELESVKSIDAAVFVPDYNVKSCTGRIYPTEAYYPMWLMEETHPLVRTAVGAYESQFSGKADVGVWQFSTNGVSTKGLYDIPTIGFGPGEEEHAHTPYDQVREADLVKALEFYAAFTLSY